MKQRAQRNKGLHIISLIFVLLKVFPLSTIHLIVHIHVKYFVGLSAATLLQGSLSVLNVAGNNLTEISELAVLSKVTQFFASNNDLSSMYDLSCAVRSWPSLSKLELQGNPFCGKKKYRDKIIVMSKRLGEQFSLQFSQGEGGGA